MRTTHILKTWPRPFADIWEGKKLFEIRKNDRNYQVDDRLTLIEYEPDGGGWTTGRMVQAEVTCIYGAGKWEIPEDTVVMGIRIMSRSDRTDRK